MKRKPLEYWTKERCKEEALKYTTKKEFRENNRTIYNASYYYKWLDEICSHMISFSKPKGYWTKQRCKEEALKYTTRKEFEEKSPSACGKARDLKFMNEICSHMIIVGNIVKRCIYSYEFPDNHVYIGLTYNIEKRNNRRKKDKKDAVTVHIIKTGLQPIKKQLTEYINIEEAKIKEGEYVEKYKNEKWIILNRFKTGGLGGNILKWTKEKCREESLKYKSRSEFQKNSLAYSPCYDHKWLDEVCSHMFQKKKPNGYWTKEKCKEEALKYTTKSQFKKTETCAYRTSRLNGWLNEICLHMIKN